MEGCPTNPRRVDSCRLHAFQPGMGMLLSCCIRVPDVPLSAHPAATPYFTAGAGGAGAPSGICMAVALTCSMMHPSNRTLQAQPVQEWLRAACERAAADDSLDLPDGLTAADWACVREQVGCWLGGWVGGWGCSCRWAKARATLRLGCLGARFFSCSKLPRVQHCKQDLTVCRLCTALVG